VDAPVPDASDDVGVVEYVEDLVVYEPPYLYFAFDFPRPPFRSKLIKRAPYLDLLSRGIGFFLHWSNVRLISRIFFILQ